MGSLTKTGASLAYYSFSNALPENAKRIYEPSLFNNIQHRLLQSTNWTSLYIVNEKKSHVYGEVHFSFENAIARSPYKSPFGSFEFSNELPPKILFEFIQFAEQMLRETGATEIIIKNPPQLLHQGNAALLETFLFNLGYHAINAEAGAVIRVDDSFESRLDNFEKRKLRRGNDAGLQTRQLLPCELKQVHAFISDCRSKKGYSLSMDYEDLLRLQQTFPERIILSGILKDDELIAASIGILIRNDVFYNFYSDHDAAYDNLSPVVMLIGSMYRYCQQHGIRFLDLGTSAVQNEPNFGLLDFKMRLGGIVTPKLTFRKTIAR